MDYHVVLTGKCNLNCRYCGGSFLPQDVPFDLQYSLEDLEQFMLKDPERSIAFYGGEPLLNLEPMLKIMDQIPAKYFSIQTNGTMLKEIPLNYLAKFHTILISIDGRKEVTDTNRSHGESIYQIVVDNSRWIKENGFTGDLIARMAVTNNADIYKEVTHLLSIKDNQGKQLFDHIHWQLDVLWGTDDILWSPTGSIKEMDWSIFDEWVSKNYNPGITKLVDLWVEKMEKGKVLGIAPFLTVMDDLLAERKTSMRCGSGVDCFAINPHGFISSCPIAYEEEFKVGDLASEPEKLRNSMLVDEPCLSCDVYDLCGGRCLHANKTMYWGKEGFERVCGTVKHFINELKRVQSKVQEMINEGIIQEDDFAYPEFNNGCEIIP